MFSLLYGSRSHKSKALLGIGYYRISLLCIRWWKHAYLKIILLLFLKKLKSSSTWLISASLCEWPLFYFYVESVFLSKLYISSKHIVSTLVKVLLHVIFMSNHENFVLTLSWDKYVASWSFCWKLKSSFVLVKHLWRKNVALWDINHVKFYTFKSPKYYSWKNLA